MALTPLLMLFNEKLLQPRFGSGHTALLIMLLVMSASMLYELIEWWAAVFFGGDAGQAFLGTQGDPWDAHKDMALATLGAGIALVSIRVGRWLRPGRRRLGPLVQPPARGAGDPPMRRIGTGCVGGGAAGG